jgi:hypothetical protein
MKNQISEVINEDLNESIKSNTGRNTPQQSRGEIVPAEKSTDKRTALEVMEMEIEQEAALPDEQHEFVQNIFKDNEEEK